MTCKEFILILTIYSFTTANRPADLAWWVVLVLAIHICPMVTLSSVAIITTATNLVSHTTSLTIKGNLNQAIYETKICKAMAVISTKCTL